ncbi:MAG: hypothetical protein KGZ25_09065 [Planctomycetes bacterium]|nr:hypothetical protein [Planctomycetota bacterium]
MSGNDKVVNLEKRVEEEEPRDVLDLILREGAQKMLELAVEAEVADYIENHKDLRDPQTGHRLVVRNGH